MRPLHRLNAPPERRPSRLLRGIAVALLTGAALFALRKVGDSSASPTVEVRTSDTPQLVVLGGDASTATLEASDASTLADSAPDASVPAAPAGIQWLDFTLNGPMETTLIAKTDQRRGEVLSQLVSRLLVWWLVIPRDLTRGDHISFLYEVVDNEPVILALRFTSTRLGRTMETFRYQVPGEPFARYYLPNGQELEARLKNGPIANYEQITARLRDGRGHRGVDFKAPIGTPVRAPFQATVEKRNWNFRANGNSLELVEIGGRGRTADLLHLASISKTAQVGAVVQRGEVIGASGNTGRSYAPHLHYQLSRDERVLDPFREHETYRVTIPLTEEFRRTVAELRAQLATGVRPAVATAPPPVPAAPATSNDAGAVAR